MNTIVRQYDGRDTALMCAYREDRIAALKNALDIASRRVVALERELEQAKSMIEALRSDVNEHRD